jgi:hypothetical protein
MADDYPASVLKITTAQQVPLFNALFNAQQGSHSSR